MFNNIVFNPIHSKILIKYIEKIIHSKEKGIWHINGKDICSKYEFAISFFKKLGINSEHIISTEYSKKMLFAPRSINQFLNCNKFEDQFNLKMPSLNQNINKLKLELKI